MSDQKPTTNQEMLIRLDERMLAMSEDVKEIKSNQALQLAKFEARLIVLETFKQTKASDDKISQWDEMSAWVRDFKKTYLLITGFIGLVGTIIGYFMNNILAWIQAR